MTETKRGVHFFSVLAHRKEARITSLATAIKVKKLEGNSVVRNKRKAREKDEGRAERCTSKGRSMPLGVRDEKALVLFPLTLGTRLNHQERSFYIPNFSPEGFPEVRTWEITQRFFLPRKPTSLAVSHSCTPNHKFPL